MTYLELNKLMNKYANFFKVSRTEIKLIGRV